MSSIPRAIARTIASWERRIWCYGDSCKLPFQRRRTPPHSTSPHLTSPHSAPPHPAFHVIIERIKVW
ncbi:unnamed protein product [Hymenolepis diminuta]|uniref:Uncharacterized protein n=1 Tax=Hymenolepis diminuta TaxID=6216 RepID=A0A564Y536_HYMDI|nr:unnamed protein product [Hymenolepis diminuta]VUZ42415.1 unnamed protein product [Hymenolepis diminuta]VUZ55115.1 unnamed protein product [Hymenolepis diminuta]